MAVLEFHIEKPAEICGNLWKLDETHENFWKPTETFEKCLAIK